MEMVAEQQKAHQFIQRLLANPALTQLTPLQKEEQIFQFLQTNARQLYPTLSSSAFFPGKNPLQIQELLASSLNEIINPNLFDLLANEVKKIDFGFSAQLREQKTSVPRLGEACVEFEKNLLAKRDARLAFTGPLTALTYNLTDKYLDEVFKRREYIYMEITRLQRLKLSKEEVQNFLKATLLLKNAVYLLTVSDTQPGYASFICDASFVDKTFDILKKQQKIIPEALLQSALYSNLSFLDNPRLEAISRLAAIFALRCQNYQVYHTVDRGADTPDKSWFNIARKNYKYYGFDIKILDELYKIAGEAGW
jgi:hypothetical protein